MGDKVLAWHFLQEDKKMRYGDNRLIEVGKTYLFDGEPILCEQGLHASIRAIDALSYAPGPIITKVELSGVIIHGDDKIVATERKVIWMADATTVLRDYSRWCALQVIHLWDAPDIVKEYLESGNEDIMAAAWDAARDAARDAAWAAARDAARDAAWAAARDAAWDADWAAARDAARDAARAAARAAAWDAARDAARDAAWDADWDAARAEMLDKFNDELTKRLEALQS